ncbi:MAG: tetratricopeptide repeat protein [Bacteroidales bacterium]|nr:tetratricopeptide repeat protein [Bacteroidales bacterium]
MKRIILAGLLFSLASTSVHAQKIGASEDPDRLFYLASEQFREKEFPSCFRTIESWFGTSENPVLLEEASFLRAASAYELNKKETSILLIQFLEKYPSSPHAAKAYYLLGCSALNAGQFEDALEFFSLCPEEELTPKEKIDYQFRFAYLSLQIKDFETARKIFRNLMNGDSRYVGSATYFYAYMDYSEGNMKDAMDGFKKIANHAQYKDAVPFFNLQLLYIEGKLDEMLDQAGKLINQKPTKVQKTELIRLMGAAWFDKKDYSQSQKYYLEYLTLDPTLQRTDIYRIGVNYYTQRNYNKAIEYLSKVTDPGDALTQSAAYHLGLCYLKQDKKDMARMNFEQASIADFDKGTKEKALYNFALLCYETSFSPFNEQVKSFQRILTEFPNSQFADKVNGYLAEVLLSSKEYENSLSVIQSIPNPDKELLQAKSQIQFLLGVERYKNGQFQNAADLFSQSIKGAEHLSISATEAYFWRGEARYQLNQLNEASLDYKRFFDNEDATKMNAYPIASYNLGYCFFNLKKYPEARIWFEKYTAQVQVKKEKNYPDALNRIGDCYFQAKDYVKAEKFYQNADLSSASGNDYAIYQKAFCLGLRKQYKSKIDLLSNFGKRFPQSDYADDALFETGRTYILIQKPDQAIASFNQLMSTFKESPLSRKAGIQIALQYFNQGKKDDAITAYKKVIEEYPGSEEAKVALSDLKMIYVNNNAVSDFVNYAKGLGNITGIEIDEQDSLSYMAAEQLLMDGEKAAAVQSFQAYLNDFPTGAFRTESHYNLGQLLLIDGKKTEAMEHFNIVAQQDGHKYQLEAAELTADAYYADKDYEKALSGYELMEKLSSDKNTRMASRLGKLRCLYFEEKYKDAVATANVLTGEGDLNTDLEREARYYRAKSCLKLGQESKAKADLEVLSAEVQTAFGAEARFLLAAFYYNQGSDKESEKIIQDFIKEGTTQSYWLARCFILLADINIDRKDDFQAKQYLLSLKENYKEKNDVQEMISTRLSAISKRIK